MICEHCHKENRSIAKFCKWCGQPLVSQNVLDRMIGLDDVKKQLKTVVDTYTYLHSRKDVMNVRLSVNAIIIGETGTGKTALAEVIRDYFYQHKIIDKPKLTMVDAVDYQRFVDKWDDNVKKARGMYKNCCPTATLTRSTRWISFLSRWINGMRIPL